MVVASHRWLGVRLDSLSALFTGVVALAALFVSQDAGKYNLILLKQKTKPHVQMGDLISYT